MGWLKELRELLDVHAHVVRLRLERDELRRQVDMLSPHVEWLLNETRKGRA